MCRNGTALVLLLGFAAASTAGCQAQPPERPQLMLFVDTTAPVVGQLASDPTLSPDPRDWPLSFGIARKQGGPTRLSIRVRGYRAERAARETIAGTVALSPPIAATLDRLVELNMPEDSVRSVRIVLDGSCFGRAVSFATNRTTCVDGSRSVAAPVEGVEEIGQDELPASRVGSWPGAREVRCDQPESPSRACIPGGFSLLGDTALVGWDLSVEPTVDPAPLRPVMMSPFWMDVTEFTVGRFRELVRGGKIQGELPRVSDPSHPFDRYCTWLGPDDDAHDALPLNCVRFDTAVEACERSGGSLPSEAQWEHAARGRGRGRRYPWGNEEPACCAASMGRYGTAAERYCDGDGPEPVGSHPASATCGGLGDESVDGLLDMAGSVAELVVDALEPYDGPCWSAAGILPDPVCHGDGHGTRGSSFASGPMTLPLALRSRDSFGASYGFRCAYGDSP